MYRRILTFCNFMGRVTCDTNRVRFVQEFFEEQACNFCGRSTRYVHALFLNYDRKTIALLEHRRLGCSGAATDKRVWHEPLSVNKRCRKDSLRGLLQRGGPQAATVMIVFRCER